jgi:hypothetical protein
MRRSLKIVAYCSVPFIILCAVLVVLASRSIYLYPKVWSAKTTVDGRVSSESSLYLRPRAGSVGILIRHGARGIEPYAFDDEYEIATVRRCKDSSFALVLGLAAAGHEKVSWGCLLSPRGLGPMGKAEDLNTAIDRCPEVFVGRVEFTADDGNRIRADW